MPGPHYRGWPMSLIEIEPIEIEEKRFPKVYLGLAISAAIASLGLAVGALITINGSNSNSAELGHGVVAVTHCDSEITMLPFESFYSQDLLGKFTLNEVQLTGISDQCSGKDFILKVLDQNGVKQDISVDAAGVPIDSVRFYFSRFGAGSSVDENGNMANMYLLLTKDSTGTIADSVITVLPTSPLVPTATPLPDTWATDTPPYANPDLYWKLSPNDNSVSIVFNPAARAGVDSIAGFAKANLTYRIILESADH